ncbi:Mesocentin [Gordonia paraffinivorans]|uniref:Mesocentin n=1 Tax=Gordonia paraffinivorans TaxID=175628 RepID=UPI00144603E8|nr:Mesocentin [Gordonia paraffinivorans]
MKRIWAALVAVFTLCLVVAGCSGSGGSTDSASSSSSSVSNVAKTGTWDKEGKPVNGGPAGADGSTGNNLTKDYCAHNVDSKCPRGSYLGAHVAAHEKSGFWDANGNPVNGGPTGADGSTGNNLTQEYCARNQDPACPEGSYVGPNAIRNPDGSHSFVKCEGTVCTNPNHGGGEGTGAWDANGKPVNGGPTGADGSTGNNLTHEYCAQNEDPACPHGTYVGPNAIKSPDGANRYVPCEGTVCTNPNHGAGAASDDHSSGDSGDDPDHADKAPRSAEAGGN